MSLVGAHVTNVRVTGFQKKQKTHVYTIEVTWSDKMAFEIYRRYADFFSFQNSLLQKFPVEAGKGDSGKRVIPSLPTVDNVLSIIGCTNTQRMMKSRLKKINNYCQTLIQLSPTVSHSELVTDFFRPVPGDTQLRLKKLKKGLSLYPMKKPAGTFDEFVLVDDYIPQEEDRKQHLMAKAGEVVKVLQQKESGWWLVCKSTKDGQDQIGWLPESYLKPHEAESIGDCLDICYISDDIETCNISDTGSEGTDTPIVSGGEESANDSDAGGERLLQDDSVNYCAIADYCTDDKSQVNFPKGARIIVIDKDEDGWWFVSYNGVEGWAPSSFLEQGSATGAEQSVSTADEEQSESPTGKRQREQPEMFYAAVDYKASKEDEVSFLKGEKVEVLKKSLLGWWTVRLLQGQTGLAPATFLTDQPLPPASSTGQIKRKISLTKRASNISLPPPRRSDVLEDLEVKDGDEPKPSVPQNPVLEQQKESGNDNQVSVASSNHDLSHSASPGSFPVVVGDTKSNHEISPTISAEVEQASPQRVPNWVPSPRKSFKNQVKEKKTRHSAIYTDDVSQKSTPSLSPLARRRFTGVFQQGIYLSTETCSTQRSLSDGSVLESCPVSPQLRRRSGSPRLMRKYAIRGPRRSIDADSSTSPRRLRSFSTDVQQSAFQLVSTTSGVSQNRRYTMPTLQQAAGRDPYSTADCKLNAVEERGKERNASAVRQSLIEAETIPVNGMIPTGNSNQCADPGEHNEPSEERTELPENDTISPECPIPE